MVNYSGYLTRLGDAARDGWTTLCGPIRFARRFDNDAEIGSADEIIDGVAYGLTVVIGTPVAAVMGGIEFLAKAGVASVQCSVNAVRGTNR